MNEYVDTGRIPFGQAMHRFSTATARQFAPYIPGLADRGSIEVGYAADLVLWDRARLKSRADYEHPLEPSSGVRGGFRERGAANPGWASGEPYGSIGQAPEGSVGQVRLAVCLMGIA